MLFPPLPLLLLPQTTEVSPELAGTFSKLRKFRKQNSDGFRQSSVRKSCFHDEAGI